MTTPLYFFSKVDVDLLHWKAEDIPIGVTPQTLKWPRYVVMLMGVLLGLVLSWSIAKIFSDSAASFALALFCFSPSLISHFSLATTDGIGALSMFLGAVAFASWVDTPNWRNALILAAAVGFMLVSKFSTVPMATIIFVLMCAEAVRRRQKLLAKHVVAVVALSWLVVCFAYNFHVARFTFANGTMDAHFQHREQDWVMPVPFSASFTVYVPGGDFIDGLGAVYRHNRDGHGFPYLLGEKAPTYKGWRSYFLWAVLLKWPTVVLLLAVAGSMVLARRKIPLSRGFWLAAILPVAFYLLALNANIQIGERHILPVYPFLLVAAAAAWHYFRKSRIALVLLTLLAVLNAADVMRYAPDYLSYFTPFIKQSQTWHYIGDSNLDWGQGLLAVKKYQDHHPDETIYLRNTGGLDPAFYGIRYKPFEENEHPHGTVIVSASEMTGSYNKDQYAMRWLLQYPQKAYLDHTMFVFQVP
jgi:4-amino-4-deoxy-L-arabinose transferase-like glycosyltransferase